MPDAVDMTGATRGRLTVVGRAKTPPGKRGAYWLCDCECGQQTVVFGGSLRAGLTKSCGCLLREWVGYGRGEFPEQLTGQRFGRLVVRRRCEPDASGHPRCLCDCDCGGETKAQVADLRAGKVGSCGCLKAEYFGGLTDAPPE